LIKSASRIRWHEPLAQQLHLPSEIPDLACAHLVAPSAHADARLGKRRTIMRKAIGSLAVLLLLLIGVGFAIGWWHINKDKSSDDKVILTVDVDKKKIKDDAAAATEKAKEIGDKIRDKVQGETVKGTIMRIDMADQRLVMKTGEKEITVQVGADTVIHLGDKVAGLKDLQDGDRLTVVLMAKDGKIVAKTITAERAA
jgi:hypothetical protein